MNVTIRKEKEADRPILDGLLQHPEVIKQLSLPSNADSWIPESRKSLKGAYRFTVTVGENTAGITALEYPTLSRDGYQINFVFGRDYWNQGICAEAVIQTVKFGFDMLKLDEIFTATDSDNPATAQVLEGVGFVKTMVWKEHVLKYGEYVDIINWSMPGDARAEILYDGGEYQVRLEELPGPDYASPEDLFEEYPFGEDAGPSETGSSPDGCQYLATASHIHYWASERWTPETRRSLERIYPFTILADGEIVGEIGLEHPTACRTTYRVGYAVGHRYWNQGICTEALRQVVRFAFDELKIHKIACDTDSENPASIRVLEKVGFKREVEFGHIKIGESGRSHEVHTCLFNPRNEE